MINLQNAIGYRLATVIVWAGVAVSGWYWTQVGLSARVRAVVDVAPPVMLPEVTHFAELARLLGAAPLVAAGPGPGPAERFSLSGVIATLVGQGAALISVDGKPARPFAVGSQIAPGYVLVGVGPREAMLADGPRSPVRAVLSLPVQRDGAALVAPSPGAAAGVSAPLASAASGASEQTFVPPAALDPRQAPVSAQPNDRRVP